MTETELAGIYNRMRNKLLAFSDQCTGDRKAQLLNAAIDESPQP